MLNWNAVIALVLGIGIVVVGVHSCSDDFAKTNLSTGGTLTRVAPTPRATCFQACLNLPKGADAQACVTACAEAHPIPVVKLLDLKPCPTATPVSTKKKEPISAKKKPHVNEFKVSHHHKSKLHKHHSKHAPNHGGHGHSYGHGHSGPQKIPAHGGPPHLTGPPPGCR